MNGNRLTHQDVERLLTDPSIENRAVAAAKIADDFSDGAFGDHERGLALQIFEIMVEDAAARVRVALAEHLKECRDISHDLALRLAQDEDAVAGPILRHSELLTDDDLIAIIRSSGDAKLFAIADRAHLSKTVTDGLVEHGTPTVVGRVMANTGARVSPTTLERVMDIYGNDSSVTGAIARRGLLPVSVAERLVTLATESLEKQLSGNAEVSSDAIVDLVMGVRERATLSLVDPRFGIGDAAKLVETLVERGRLTPSIILRGLCMGDIAFFEAAMAHLTELPQLNAQILIHDEGRRGFQALWQKSRLPPSFYPVALAAIEVGEEIEYDGGAFDRERCRRRVIERVLTRCAGAGIDLGDIDHGSVEYLLAKLGELQAAEALSAV